MSGKAVLITGFVLALALAVYGIDVRNFAGEKHALVSGRYREPILLVDTLRLRNGVGTADLSAYFNEQQSRVVATSATSLYVVVSGVLRTELDSVYSYSAIVLGNGRSIRVKSSGASDSGKVVIMAFSK